MKRVNVSLPDDVHATLETVAKSQSRTIANLLQFLAQQEADRVKQEQYQQAS